MAIATILPTARTVFLDANNNPLAGGFVYFYVPPNTTTLKTTWQDSTQTIPNTNPVILDGNGSALIYGSGAYLQEVFDSQENLIYSGLTQDPYSLIFNSDGTFTGTTTFTGPVSLGSAATATTPTTGDSSTKVATTAFVAAATTTTGNAGGFINKIRNPGVTISQRGVSGSVTTGNANYGPDGYIIGATGATVGWGAPDAGPITSDDGKVTAPAYGYIVGNTSMTDSFIRQRIEGIDASSLSGQVCTFQILVRNSTGSSITPTLTVKHAGSLDNWSSPVTDVNAVSLQSVATGATIVLAYNFTANASSYLGLEITVDFGNSINSNAKTIYFSALDLRVVPGLIVGINNAPPSPELRSIAPELAYCQRYYQILGGETGSDFVSHGYTTGTVSVDVQFITVLPVNMRAIPTVTIGSPTSISVASGANVSACSVFTVNTAATYGGVGLTLTHSGGFAAGAASVAFINTVSDSIKFSAEL